MHPTQRGDLRDKAAVTDPAAVPPEGDIEAAGHHTPAAVAAKAEHTQAEVARRAVPELDASRTVSTHEHPGKRRFSSLGGLIFAGLAIVALVGAALYLTLPG
jgi:hypothetical protein